MKKTIVILLCLLAFTAVDAFAVSIAASQALGYISAEYYYDISAEDMLEMENICENYENEQAIELIVSKLDEYSEYYTAQYIKNLSAQTLPQNDLESLETDGMFYIKINTFAADTGSKFQDIWNSVEENDKVFVDLTDCTGGYISSMLETARCLLPDGVVCVAQYKDKTEVYEVEDSLIKLPYENLYILVSEKTASSAEILSCAVKTQKCGTVLGSSNTFGKTSIQRLVPLKSGGIMKFTIGEYSVPHSETITGTGVVPDRIMPQPVNK